MFRRLRNIAIFFVCLNANAFPSHKFLDDWLNVVWGKRVILHVNFYRMIHKGLFIIFLKTHNMQERILKKTFWNVDHSLFQAYPCSTNGNFDEVIKKSMPNWVEIKNLHA